MPDQQLVLTSLDQAREPAFIAQVKQALNLPADAELQIQNIARGAGAGGSVDYAVTMPVELRGAEFGAANGIAVDEQVTASLEFDARGQLVRSRVSPIDERHLQMVKDNVRKLAAADQIYLAAPNEEIDSDMLRAKRKPWYVVTDAQARKRLRRAYMA